ncbi:MAG: tetratricopeptide repeat protein, partial [Acidobacteriia bacterium]|nr:tetratricopeptide repeat protein [Terriglobia bacterium]
EGDSADPDYHFNLGYTLWRAGQYEAAVESLRAVVARNPNDAEATALLGRALKRDGPRPGDPRSDADQQSRRVFRELLLGLFPGRYSCEQQADDQRRAALRVRIRRSGEEQQHAGGLQPAGAESDSGVHPGRFRDPVLWVAADLESERQSGGVLQCAQGQVRSARGIRLPDRR